MKIPKLSLSQKDHHNCFFSGTITTFRRSSGEAPYPVFRHFHGVRLSPSRWWTSSALLPQVFTSFSQLLVVFSPSRFLYKELCGFFSGELRSDLSHSWHVLGRVWLLLTHRFLRRRFCQNLGNHLPKFFMVPLPMGIYWPNFPLNWLWAIPFELRLHRLLMNLI